MDKTLVFKALAIRTLHVHSDASTLTETDVKFALDVCVPRYNRIIAKSPKAAARYGFIFYRNTTFLSTLRHPFRRALRCTHLMFIYSAFFLGTSTTGAVRGSNVFRLNPVTGC